LIQSGKEFDQLQDFSEQKLSARNRLVREVGFLWGTRGKALGNPRTEIQASPSETFHPDSAGLHPKTLKAPIRTPVYNL
jgi:predicted sugar kinase